MRPSRKVLWSVVVVVVLIVAGGTGFYLRPVSYFNALTSFQLWTAGARSHTIEVDGIRMHYYVQGPKDGAPVMLVHGLGGHSEDWRNLTPYLVQEGFRIYMPDLPGYGRSGRPQNFSYSVPDEAKIVVAFMDALGLKQVELGGWSMGGWIVQRVAYEHPERVKRLMLFDSAGLYAKPTWNTNLFMPATQLELDQLDALLMPHPPQAPAFIVRDILRISHEHAWVIRRAMDSMLTGQYTTDDILPKLKMPVLIVWGSEDKITPLAQGQTMHKLISQSQIAVAQGCGHLAPVQCEDQIGPKVLDFLR